MISPFPSSPGEDPAIQFCFGAAHPHLDHRVSTLRVGPVMMGWTAPDGIYVPNWWM
jgi:hypothetical protein